MGERSAISRREFLRRSALGTTVVLLPVGCSGGGDRGRSVVAVARDPAVWNGEILSRTRYAAMLDRAVAAVVGTSDPKEAWRRLFTPEDAIGVKVNCLAGPRLSTPFTGVLALADCLRKAGIPPGRLLAFERTEREMRRAGYAVDGGEIRCLATDRLPGGGYEPRPTLGTDVGSCLSRVLTRRCTALVSFGVAKDHDLAGISAAMKNLYGVIHNPNKYHDNRCDPFVADVLGLPPIRTRLRLAIVDATRAQCHGGPAFKPAWAWRADRIFVGTDPVAVDRCVADLIEAERARRDLPTLREAGREPTWLETAQARGLGRADPAAIVVREV